MAPSQQTDRSPGKLFFFCGKMGAGKSTKSQELALNFRAVLLSEDEWLAAHFPNQIHDLKDYFNYSRLIKPFIEKHVQAILKTGISVVMDFPGNTKMDRLWLAGIANNIDCPHEMIYLDVSDATCLKQIAKRRIDQPERSQFDTEEIFHKVTRFFEAPVENENLNISIISEEPLLRG